MTAPSKFPLLRLPHRVILRTIQTMGIEKMLEFSLISKTCKHLVTSIKFETFSLLAYIGADIRICIVADSCDPLYLFFYYMGGGEMDAPGNVFTSDDYEFSIVKKLDWDNNFGMKDWIRHLSTIFNCRSISHLHFEDCAFKFDIDGIREVFGNSHELYVQDTQNFLYNRSIFQKFSHIENVKIGSVNVFEDSKNLREVFIQNLNSLVIDEDDEAFLTLDDLLLINSKSFKIHNLQIPLKDLNKLIKLWRKGALPRLKDLCIYYLNGADGDEEEILKGIGQTPVKPRVNIHRNDGTKAIIQIAHLQYSDFILHCFQMNVLV